MPALANQFRTEALEGYPQDPTKIQDFQHIATTPFQIPTTGNRRQYCIVCIQVFQNVRIEIRSVKPAGFLCQKSYSNAMPTPLAVQDLSRQIVLIITLAGVLDLLFMCKLPILPGIHRNIAKLAYVITKVN